MGTNYQLHRAWANTAKGIRQCQRADKVLLDDNLDSAARHFSKALNYFGIAFEHLSKAEDDAAVKAGNLLDDGNLELEKAVEQFMDGHVDSAEKHYEMALEKYDEALDLID